MKSLNQFRFAMALVLLAVSAAADGANVPHAKHVYLVMLENQDYADIMNGSMPYLNSLAREYATSANYFANTHPSIGNYFMLTTGDVITNNDWYDGEVSVDNLVRELKASGKTWKSYSQSLPSVGFLGNKYPYMRRHNPFVYFTDVKSSETERNNVVPLEQFTADLNTGQLADFVYLLPDLKHDMHDCPGWNSRLCRLSAKERAADDWLKGWLQPLLDSDRFKDNGLVIITFDESDNDDRHGGGLIPFIMLGSKVKRGYVSHTLYQHQNALRTICDALGVKNCPGAAASAEPMADFFQ